MLLNGLRGRLWFRVQEDMLTEGAKDGASD